MEKGKHLAITTVPVQTWNEVFDEQQAFKNGTIFPELNKPFYVTEEEKTEAAPEPEEGTQEGMLKKIQKTSFMLDDLRLYMDTHPEDEEGLKLLTSLLAKRKTLLKDFAENFYPLTFDCMEGGVHYSWTEGKIPWERSV